MKTVSKREEVAGRAQQFLPGPTSSLISALQNLPQPSRPPMPQRIESPCAQAHPTMARVSEVISREVRMFKRGGDDMIDVILTPDIKTQISLRLQWRDGQVAVQARCDLGDYQMLQTHWPLLQSALADHGVRLSHLTQRIPSGFTEFFHNPTFASRQKPVQPSPPLESRSEDVPAPPRATARPVSTPASGRFKRFFAMWL